MAFTGFINEFSNSPIQPTFQSYLALDFTSITEVLLEWPFANANATYPYAQTIQVTVNPSATNTIYMPDASMATQGQTNTIINSGADTILVKSFTGTLIATILTTQQWLITLTDNTSDSGTWIALQLASTTSSATAASLIDPSTDSNSHSNAGGLAAFGSYLKQNMLVNVFDSGSTYTQESGDRGALLVWNAGTGIYQCLASATLTDGFVFSILNNSTVGAQVTVTPNGSDTIDGDLTSFVLNPGDSSSFCADGGSNIYSFASSQSNTNVTTLVNVLLTTSVSNTITLTSTQAGYSIQQYIGTVGSSPYPTQTIIYPNNIVSEYIAYNASTTNSILVQLSGSSLSYTIPPGDRLSLFSNGTNLYNSPNFVTNAIIYLADGSAAVPSLSFSNDQTTGLFRQTSGGYTGALGLAQNATATFYSQDTLNTSIVPVALPDGSVSAPSITFTSDETTGIYRPDSGTYTDSVAITQDATTVMYFTSTQNVSTVTINTDGVTYQDNDISIYSMMRAYG